MRRIGHSRPIGTITALWRLQFERDGEPRVGDFVAEIPGPHGDPNDLQRAYLVVGVEEPSRVGAAWRVMYERLAWPPDRIDWTWYRMKKGAA